MAFTSRLFKSGDTERVTEGDDGFGGKDKTEVPIAEDFDFHVFNITPWDREVLATRYGIEDFSVMMKAVAGWLPEAQNNDIIQVSETEKYRIISISPMYGRGPTPHHMSMLLQAEEPD